MKELPTFDRYMNPILDALRALGGSATILELVDKVTTAMGLSEEQLQVLHDPEHGNRTEAEYRMAWARTYLKKAGYVENSERGVWALTPQGREATKVEPREVRKVVERLFRASKTQPSTTEAQQDKPNEDEVIGASDGDGWRESLILHLQKIPPPAFERLCQRLLRECGFVEVTVTGRSGDEGIDGTGILRIQELVSFQVLFQCKRYKGSVGPGMIRDFRGAMVGRTDKGLFITTGTFSREAQKEATRDGAPPLDLIDGLQLVDLLKRLGLGVRTIMVEKVTIDTDWFSAI